MNILATKPCFTPDDLLTMPDGDLYELVDGKLVERHMGFESGFIGGNLYHLLSNFAREHQLGWLPLSDTGYQCFPDTPNKVRKPDLSFVRKERLSSEQVPRGHAKFPPDLAVEVVSPNDLFEDVSLKVVEYLGAGVRLVWVVDPATRLVYVHRPGGPGTILRADDDLSGEDVVPGFLCRVADLFLPPAGTTPSA